LTLLLDKIVRVNSQRFAELIADLEIRPRHVGLLTAASRQKAPSQAELGVWLGVGASAVVALVDELEARGAVVRRPDLANRRRWTITLTEKGERLLTEASRRAEDMDHEFLSGLSQETVAAFVTTTLSIAARLGVGGVQE
jgi:DNA-binding MarR family transcriptional regulator